MKSSKNGFTVIEVVLFLAVSATLFVGLLAGISSSVARQRYNDATNDFVEVLKSVYSEAINVENYREGVASNQTYCTLPAQAEATTTGSIVDTSDTANDARNSGYPGRSQCAVYGRLITFGEGTGSDSDKIYVYDVIGRVIDLNEVVESSGSGVIGALQSVNADVLAVLKDSASGYCSIAPAGNVNTHTPQWDAKIQDTAGNAFRGSILIVRSPYSSAIHTYVSDEVVGIQAALTAGFNTMGCSKSDAASARSSSSVKTLKDYLSTFTARDVDFCVYSEDIFNFGTVRRNVRILEDGRNATAVKLVDNDDASTGGNACL